VEELKQKIEDQEGSLMGRSAFLEAKNLIWGVIVNSVVEFRPYLDMLEDKATLSCKALDKCVVLNETMTKRTPDIAHNTISLLNTVTNEELQILGVKDRITVMMWARKVVCKHKYVNNVKRKAEEMRNAVHQVKNLFQPLFNIGLPTFWDSLGKLVPIVEH